MTSNPEDKVIEDFASRLAGAIKMACARVIPTSALRAALKASLDYDGLEIHPKGDGWQDISTAPKDTPVDAWMGNAEFPMRYPDAEYRKPTESEYWVQGSDEPSDEDGTIGTGYNWFCNMSSNPLLGDNTPTHWQPFPEPPEGTKP